MIYYNLVILKSFIINTQFNLKHRFSKIRLALFTLMSVGVWDLSQFFPLNQGL